MQLIRKGAACLTLLLALALLAPGAARAGCNSSSFANSMLYIGNQGALSYSQTLNGILYTEGQIGAMADRILWTETQIGDMSNRIVYVTQFSQNNSLSAIFILTNLVYLGKSNGGYQYSASFLKVPALPFGWLLLPWIPK